ncbi:MAG: hypothetical protein ACXVP1_06905 [Thermoleophilia bacterium]
MSDLERLPSGSPPVADPLHDEIEARAAELRELIAATPAATSYGPPVGFLELRERRRRRFLLASGGMLMAAGALTFVLIVTGVSLLGVMIFAPGVLLLALAIGWRPFYSLYLPGLALAGWGAGMIVDRALSSSMFLGLVGLGCGLVLAWLIRRWQAGWAHPWPLIGGLVLAGLGLLAGAAHPWAFAWHAWPLLLVALGAALVVRAVRPARTAGGPPART